tara:strand:- start:555 stop:833 length:279 start_codon:yes stop_codon:yes gene_type:complete
MQISLAESICQEFSDGVWVSNTSNEKIEDIKCCIDIAYFPELMDRMAEINYAMIQVQKDRNMKKCFVWFEPCSDDITLIDEIDEEDEDLFDL